MPEPEISHASSRLDQILLVSVCLTFFSLSVGTAPLTLASLLSLTVWLIYAGLRKERDAWLGQEWSMPVAALFVLPWIAILWTSSPPDQALKIAERSHYWLFAFVAGTLVTSERPLRIIIFSFISGTVVIATLVTLYLLGVLQETRYLHNFLFRSYISFSLLLVVSLLLLAYFYKSAERHYKVPLLFVMFLVALTVTQLKGRSAYVSLVVLSPWMFLTMFGRRRLFGYIAAIAILITLIASSRTVRERIALVPEELALYQSSASSSYTMADGTSNTSSVGLRLQMWKAAGGVFRSSPLFGAGTNGYQYETEKSAPGHGFAHPHNSYLYVAANYGLSGLALYAWLLVVTLRRAWRSRGQLSGYSILAFVSVILIGSLTDTQILSTATGIALGFIVGIPTPGSES